jgi:hypothetical protein
VPSRIPVVVWSRRVVLQLAQLAATLADRWGFRSAKLLQVRASLNTTLAERIGDKYLATHKTVPFSGGFKAVHGSVRKVLGGEQPHPAWLLTQTNQMVRLTNRVDPDAGGWGRDAEIDTVTYDHDSLRATVKLSDDRGGFEALVTRLAAVIGEGA